MSFFIVPLARLNLPCLREQFAGHNLRSENTGVRASGPLVLPF
jgi:hypothetical protein